MTTRINRRQAVSGTVAALAATVCGVVSLRDTRASEQDNLEHMVEIANFEFLPATVMVRPGDKITWINRDIAPHTATAKDKSWDTKRLKRGERKSVIVEPGMASDYYCRFHPVMKAKLELIVGE